MLDSIKAFFRGENLQGNIEQLDKEERQKFRHQLSVRLDPRIIKVFGDRYSPEVYAHAHKRYV